MQKHTSNVIPKFKFYYQTDDESPTKVEASAYHLNITDSIDSFTLTTTTKDEWLTSMYGMIFIHSAHKKIFDYELCVPNDALEEILIPTLEQKTEKQCVDLILKMGYTFVSESTKSIEHQLLLHGLVNMRTPIANLLNTNAINVLKQLQLGIVPKLYNWLVEGDEEQCKYRSLALLSYPILLIHIVTPTIGDMYPLLLNPEQLAIRPSEPRSSINKRIDCGETIDEILESALNLPKEVLIAIKGKRFWEITQDKQPEIYARFEEEILAYKHMSTF